MSGAAEGAFTRVDLPDAATLASTLAASIAAQLEDVLRHRPEASLVVPGGRSPVALLEALSRTELDWARVTVRLTDERWVRDEDPACNESMVRRHLARAYAQRVRIAGLRGDAASAEQAAERASRDLATVDRDFDVVVAGMGEDGHFASLFADMPGLAEALEPNGPARVVVVSTDRAPHLRLSLTLGALARASIVHLLAIGEGKARVLDRAAALPSVDWPLCPVGALLGQRRAPILVWRCPG